MDKHKTILLTGASGGLGRVIAKTLIEEGHDVILHGNENMEVLRDISDTLDAPLTVSADLTKEDEILSMVKEIKEKKGTIDVLINNAGVSSSAISWKHDTALWDHTHAVNVRAPFILSRELLPGMREQGWGRVINFASIVAFTGYVGTTAYASSKAGLTGLTRTMALEVAKKGVTVNCIAPGYFSEGMIHEVPEDLQEEILKTIPAGKFGDPKEIAACVRWIMSEEAGYLNGQTIHLNGGAYA